MVAQVARGIPGVEVAADGSLTVDVDELDPEAEPTPVLDGSSHAGLLAFLSLAAGRTDPVKVQLTGPVTLGTALLEAGAPGEIAYTIAGAAVRAYGAALVGLCTRRLPDADLVVFIDEPGLVRAGKDGGLPLVPEVTVDLLSSALAVLEPHATTGVHCCGRTDWRLPTAAGATILSLPADAEAVAASSGILNAHLERGGWIAWGAVPTSEPIGQGSDRLWRRLTSMWCDLVQAGCDPAQLRAQALITPACGLAGHGVSQSARALKLAANLGERVTDQAIAARLSAGA
jgi:methionine synthase II (cobalamin-independent)